MPSIRSTVAVCMPMFLTLALSGCAALSGPQCAAGEEQGTSELMYFGTAKPDGVVTSFEWTAFLQASVTPRFPRGFTAWPAAGQWQDADGTVIREASYVLSLVHIADDGSEDAVRAIVSEYKARFQQQAVLRVRNRVCITF